jgi:hypothetical protein
MEQISKKKPDKQDDIYHLINTEHKKKKLPLFTKVVITFELSFLIITFILAFRRAMIILLQNNKQEIEEVQITPKKKQIFKSNTDLLKICICTFAKNQNLYINEFVEFYQKIGINKIFLYDNNDENGEKFDDILKLYINNGTVEIINWRGKNAEHEEMMSDCYKNNYINYDWLIFYEIDEYIHIKENNDLKLFLSDQKFDNCECIYLNWLFHTDNNLIYYDNRTLQERFPIPEPNPQKNNSNVKHLVKTIMKGHGKIIEINNIYKLSDNLKGCDGNGNPPIFNGNEMVENDFENNYIIHYSCKSTEEFLKKLNNESIDDSAKNQSIYEYFLYNEINEEKINYIENHTNLNLTEFRLTLSEENIKK